MIFVKLSGSSGLLEARLVFEGETKKTSWRGSKKKGGLAAIAGEYPQDDPLKRSLRYAADPNQLYHGVQRQVAVSSCYPFMDFYNLETLRDFSVPFSNFSPRIRIFASLRSPGNLLENLSGITGDLWNNPLGETCTNLVGDTEGFMQHDYSKLSPIGQSVINEMANIGLGNATTSLAQMTNHAFDMSVPNASSISLEELPLQFGETDEPFVGIYMPVEGDAEGHMGFFLSWSSAQALWRMLLSEAPETMEDISDLQASALIEVGNIINGSFLRAISEFSGVSLHACPPLMSVDMISAMLASLAVEASTSEHMAISIRTEIFDKDRAFEGFFVMIPTVAGIELIFKNLGVLEVA